MAAPFIPVANTAQFGMQFSQPDSSFAENIYWVKRTSAWTLSGLTTMAAAIKAWWDNGDGTQKPKNWCNSSTEVTAISYRDYTTVNGLTGIYQTGLPDVGASGFGPLELGLTFALTARTGLAGRNYRGRTFLVGLPTNVVSDRTKNTVDATSAGELAAAWTALVAAVTAADAACTLVVCSRYGGVPTVGGKSVPRVAGITTPIVSYGYSKLFLDFQRRRAPGHNRHR